jgi:hypothetical protein
MPAFYGRLTLRQSVNQKFGIEFDFRLASARELHSNKRFHIN